MITAEQAREMTRTGRHTRENELHILKTIEETIKRACLYRDFYIEVHSEDLGEFSMEEIDSLIRTIEGYGYTAYKFYMNEEFRGIHIEW